MSTSDTATTPVGEGTAPRDEARDSTGDRLPHAPGSGAAAAVSAVTGAVPVAVTVTAVVVTRGHTPYLARTLAALGAQSDRPDRVVVVDVGASASMRDYRDLQLGDARFVAAPDARSFGQAVELALSDAVHAPTWLWLLHDDSAPEPDALAHLVAAVEHTPSVAVAGAKQRGWSDPDVLLEVGFTTSPLGRRMTGIDVAEIDQGQHDARDDVLAVGLAGALVRWGVWDQLGGTDPEYGAFGDGLDLCRRARLAGHRVVVVPRAVVHHAQASLRGLRVEEAAEPAEPADAGPTDAPVHVPRRRRPDIDTGPGNTYRARRRSQMYYRLVGVHGALVPFLIVGTVLWSPVRAMYRLAAKRPMQAVDEIVAALVVVAVRLGPLSRARGGVRRTSTVPRSALTPLLGTWREVTLERRNLRRSRLERSLARTAPTEIERSELRALAVRRRTVLAAMAVVLLGLTAWVYGPMLGTLASGGRLVGGALLTADGSLGDLWRAATSGWVQTGLGEQGPADPLLTVLVPFTVLTGGHLQAAVNVLLIGSFVLAGLGAWFAAGAVTRSVALRSWAVAVWVVAPPLLVGLAGGNLGAVLAHAALPWAAYGVARAVGAQATDHVEVVVSRRTLHAETAAPPSLGSAAAAGLALALAVGAAPMLLPAALVALVVVGAVVHQGRRYLVLVAVPALVVCAPYLLEVVTTWTDGGWRLLAAGPGVPSASVAAEPWQMLLGWPGEPAGWFDPSADPWTTAAAWAPYVLTGLVAVAALVGLLRRARVGGARLGWVLALLGLATAVPVAATTVAVDPATGASLPGSPGPALSLVVLGLLVAGLVGLRRRDDGELPAAPRPAPASRSGRLGRALVHVGAAVLVLVCVAAPVGAGWAWVDAEVDRGGTAPAADGATQVRPAAVGSLQATTTTVVPPVGQQLQAPPRLARVLSLETRPDGTIVYALLRGDGAQLVDSAAVARLRAFVGSDASPADAVPQVVGDISAVGGADVADRLADLGVGGVLVPATPDPTRSRAELVTRLDTIDGLERVTQGRSAVFWRVARTDAADAVPPAWATLVAGDGTDLRDLAAQDAEVHAQLLASDAPRRVVLAEHADPGWSATLDGRALRPATVDGRQAFEVGTGAGTLAVRYDGDGLRTPWIVGGGLVLLVVALLALPTRRRRGTVR
ncbi:glycosyltransferase [Cellulomonas sp. PhB143]|uniref:glycosyltransferase n=1 Tax=Cellulomonas sp. PhB143 TaxID=2485186 RepID=UPI000F49EE7B|nr:glycosyltransferase [Cellulomonas sp. PhB143]ROS78569.1 GT2 family glycosyltransferase [Cellulomonas sp. PhB143]